MEKLLDSYEQLTRIDDYPIADIKGFHKLSKDNPMMAKDDRTKLKSSIEKNGVKEAIYLYRKFVIDGRHRYLLSKGLGLNTIPARIIPNNIKKEELKQLLKEIVQMKETRRHQTPTQKFCVIVREYFKLKENGVKITQQEMAKTNKLGIANFKNAVYIYKNDKEVFNKLLDGYEIRVKHNSTIRLDVVAASIKEEKQNRLKQDEIKEVNLDDVVNKVDIPITTVNNLFKESKENGYTIKQLMHILKTIDEEPTTEADREYRQHLLKIYKIKK